MQAGLLEHGLEEVQSHWIGSLQDFDHQRTLATS
jgi:hypothetical protein